MNIAEQIEQLSAENIALWEKRQENIDKKEALMAELFPDCEFCHEGNVSIFYDQDEGYYLYCTHCNVVTPYSKKVAEVVEYWKALERVKEGFDLAKKEEESGE